MTRIPSPPAGGPRPGISAEGILQLLFGAVPPALRIFPRDTVRTWTLDDNGIDAKLVRRSPGGNPQPPFYIEGAVPGDTLVVKLNRFA